MFINRNSILILLKISRLKKIQNI